MSTVDAFEQSLIHRGRGAKTAAKYARTIEAFDRWNSGQIGRAPADAYAAWLQAGRRANLAPGTIRQRLAAGRSYLDFLGAERGPLSDYKLPPLPEPEAHPLPGGMNDAYAMLDLATGSARHAIALQALAGLRISEAISITRDAVQIRHHGAEKYTVLSVRGKGEKVRDIPVSDRLAALLEQMPTESGARLAPLSDRGARAAITRIAGRAQIVGHNGDPVSSHDLRATFATELYDRTNDIVLVQRMLGHSSVTTTQVYIGRNAGQAREAVQF